MYGFFIKRSIGQTVHAFCWKKIKPFIKTKRDRKWKISCAVLERRTLYFSSYKNRKLKVKLWWFGTRERKKIAFFVPFILSEGNCSDICDVCQCTVHWIQFQNIHTFIYQKPLLHTLFCLFLKSSKSFSVFISCSATREVSRTFRLQW